MRRAAGNEPPIDTSHQSQSKAKALTTVAILPVVIEADIAVAQVAQGGRHAVHLPFLRHHAIHDGLHEGLVHVAVVEVPRSPPKPFWNLAAGMHVGTVFFFF